MNMVLHMTITEIAESLQVYDWCNRHEDREGSDHVYAQLLEHGVRLHINETGCSYIFQFSAYYTRGHGNRIVRQDGSTFIPTRIEKGEWEFTPRRSL